MSDVQLWGCHGMHGNQEWTHLPSHQLRHVASSLCLQAHAADGGHSLVMNTCEQGNEMQQWRFSDYDEYS